MSNTTNYYKEFKNSSKLLDNAEVLSLLSSLVDTYILEKGTEYEKVNNKSADTYLKSVVEIFSNILEQLDTKTQEEFNQFLEESKDDHEERFQKMKFVISESLGLQGKALKKAAMNLDKWLTLSPENDHSEFQAILYNLSVEIEKNQIEVINNLNNSNN